MLYWDAISPFCDGLHVWVEGATLIEFQFLQSSNMCFMLCLFALQSYIQYYVDVYFEYKTSAVLRLECSIDCISGSVGHQQNIFGLFFHCQRFFWRRKNFKNN